MREIVITTINVEVDLNATKVVTVALVMTVQMMAVKMKVILSSDALYQDL